MGTNHNRDLIHGVCNYIDSQENDVGRQFAHISSFPEIADLWQDFLTSQGLFVYK